MSEKEQDHPVWIQDPDGRRYELEDKLPFACYRDAEGRMLPNQDVEAILSHSKHKGWELSEERQQLGDDP